MISEKASPKSNDGKSETPSRISVPAFPAGADNFVLSWSHYLFLMRIDNPDERNFYEQESIQERWSLRELKRQFNSALYERLSLSRDKRAIAELSRQGIIVGKPEDCKSPVCSRISRSSGGKQIFRVYAGTTNH